MDYWTNYRKAAWAMWRIPGLVPAKINRCRIISSVQRLALISLLAQRSGLSEEELTKQLSQVLPGVVDKLTPAGRLPTLAELSETM